MTRHLLQGLFVVLGVVAILAGTASVLAGASIIPGDNPVSPSVESELRFYATFWVAYGAAALWVAPRVDHAALAIRFLAGFLFLGGIARAMGWVATGQPDGLLIALMVAELLIPIAMIVLQSRSGGPRAAEKPLSGRHS